MPKSMHSYRSVDDFDRDDGERDDTYSSTTPTSPAATFRLPRQRERQRAFAIVRKCPRRGGFAILHEPASHDARHAETRPEETQCAAAHQLAHEAQ
jgi:hypothetical protein